MPAVKKRPCRVVGIELDGYWGEAHLFQFKSDDFSTCAIANDRFQAITERRKGTDTFVAWLMEALDPQEHLGDI
jgi:hypothetical protein